MKTNNAELFLIIAVLLNFLVSNYTDDIALIAASGVFFGLCAVELGRKKHEATTH